MSGKEILVDTNILLYLLDGNDTIGEILQGKTIYLSFITELELLGFKNLTENHETQINHLLNDCSIIVLNDRLKKEYVKIRRASNLKLPDAIIAATAISLGLPLISSDKQFKNVKGLNLIFYEM